jgi:hypothetical protein
VTTYRTGNHWGVTIVAEPDTDTAYCCDRGDHPGHTGARLVAVVTNGDRALAERICALLNGETAVVTALDRRASGLRTAYRDRATDYSIDYINGFEDAAGLAEETTSAWLSATQGAEITSGVPRPTPGPTEGAQGRSGGCSRDHGAVP